MEYGNQYLHVASLGIYDQSTAPEGKVRIKQILKFFNDRIQNVKVFRRRLVVPPFNIDRQYSTVTGYGLLIGRNAGTPAATSTTRSSPSPAGRSGC
jgi:hypothetical protein